MMKQSENSDNPKRRSRRKRLGNRILTIVIAICFVQFLYSFFYNITRYVVLNGHIYKLESLNKVSTEENKTLKSQLKNYSSFSGIEELARNNLKMVGTDEVLVLIKNNPVKFKKNVLFPPQ